MFVDSDLNGRTANPNSAVNANRVHGLLTISRRAHRSPISPIPSPHRHLSSKSQLSDCLTAKRRQRLSQRK